MGLAPITTSGPTITVSSMTELMNAYAELSSTSGGGKIVLQSGDYGNLSLLASSGGDAPVIIASADPSDPATFDRLSFDNVSNVRIEDVHVDNPTNGSAGSSVVKIQNASENIQLADVEVNGLVDSTYDGHFGIYITGSSNIGIYGSDIHDVRNGIYAQGSSGIEVSENTFDYLGEDAMKFSGVSDILIEDNIGPRMLFPVDGAHSDFVQFTGSSSDIVVRGNVLLLENTSKMQGIFMHGWDYTNVLIEQNIIATGMIRGISVSSGTNVVARDNTLLDIAGFGHNGTKVLVDGESYGNIESSYLQDTGQDANLTLQMTHPDQPFHYDDVFVNAYAGPGMTIADLTPVENSLAYEYGATERLLELLGATLTDNPVARPAGDPVQIVATPADEPAEATESDSDGGSKFFLVRLLEIFFGIFGSDDKDETEAEASTPSDDGPSLGEVVPITGMLDEQMPPADADEEFYETDLVA